jgi:site-specific recombinase XerD
VRKSTIKRYRAVFDKFEPFAKARGVTVWNGVTAELLIDYAAHLAKLNYAHKTQGNELVTLKQAISWLIKTGHLAGTTPPELTIRRAECQPAYCYRPVEVAAMIKHCQTHPKLHWMEGIITALACTGVRISELAALCWADIDLENCRLLLTDETGRQANAEQRRMLKSGRSRTFPIHPDLVKALRRLPRRGRYVFYGPRSGRLKPDTVRNVLVREVIEPLTAKFPAADGERGIKHGRVHSFRHYFCSTCANNGVPERMVMDWLGHADSAMIRHYYHLHDEEAQRRMKSVDFLGGAGRRSVGQGEGEPKKEDVEPPPAERRVDADGRD